VKLFQEANGLTADGIAGPGTLAILFGNDAVAYEDRFGRSRTVEEPEAEPAEAVTTAAPKTNIVLQWQSEGEDVLRYQQRLSVQVAHIRNHAAIIVIIAVSIRHRMPP
jgi:hypothetical protein